MQIEPLHLHIASSGIFHTNDRVTFRLDYYYDTVRTILSFFEFYSFSVDDY